MVDPEACQRFTTDEVKAALRNINPTKAAGPDKIHPRLLHHLGPVFQLTSIIKNHDQSPTRMESSRHQTNTKRREGPTEDGAPAVTNRLQYFAESMYLLTEHQAGFRHGRRTEDQLL